MVQTKPLLTPREYLTLERAAEEKSEYIDGEMVAMPRVNIWHSLILVNLIGEIHGQLRQRSGEVYPSIMRLHIPGTGLYTYPDVTVVLDFPRFTDQEEDNLLNPTLLIEILSPASKAYDRGKKFEHYKTIDSLAEYVLVSQDTPWVEQRLRQDNNNWHIATTSGLDQKVILSSIGCELELAKIYQKIPLG